MIRDMIADKWGDEEVAVIESIPFIVDTCDAGGDAGIEQVFRQQLALLQEIVIGAHFD